MYSEIHRVGHFLKPTAAAILAVVTSDVVQYTPPEWKHIRDYFPWIFFGLMIAYIIREVSREWVASYTQVYELKLAAWQITASQSAQPVTQSAPGEIIAGVPNEFLRDFLSKSGGTNLAPIRTWAEGSNERAAAQILTDEFIRRGWAIPAKGNQPAQFVNGWGSGAVGRYLGVFNPKLTPSPTTSAPETA